MTGPSITVETVEALISAGDVAGMVALFGTATDKDRARVRDLADHDRRWQPMSSDDRHPPPDKVALEVLYAATARAQDVAVWMYRVNVSPEDLLEPVVAAIEPRGERFMRTLGKQMLKPSDGWRTPWCLLRTLVRRGLIDPVEIDDDAYIRAFAFGRGADLAGDPELADREVWRLFEVSGALTLTNLASWDWQLLELAGRSEEHRERMLDALLGALATDFAPGQLSAYIRLAGVLEPTDEELSARAGAVAALCRVPQPVRSQALAWLERVFDGGGIESGAAVAALRPALVGREKKVALDALRLADRMAPGEAGASAIVAALGHAHPDVAARALKLIERRAGGDLAPDLRAAILATLDAVPAAVRPRVAELAGASEATSDGVLDRVPVAVARASASGPSGDVADPWHSDRRAPVLEDPEQLVAVAATLLEGQGDGDDFEFLVAGLPLLAGDSAGAARLFAPLRKRAAQLRSPTRSSTSLVRASTVAEALARMILDIVDGRQTELLPGEQRSVIGLTLARLFEAAAAVTRSSPLIPLAAPTHRGGLLQLDTYLERVGRGAGLGPADAQQAALRVGLVGTSPGLDARPVTIRKGRVDAHLCPLEFVRTATEPSDDPLVEGGLSFFPWLSGNWAGRRGFIPYDRNWWPWDLNGGILDVRVAVTVASFRPDLVAAAGSLAFIHPGIDYEYRGEHALPTLQFLGEPSVPLEGPALVLLAIAASTPVGERAAAVDSAIAAVDQHRLDPVAWGRETARLQATQLITLQRVAAAATDLATAGPAHRIAAQQYLLSVVAHQAEPPPTLFALLDALVELGADDLGMTVEAQEALQRLATRSSRAGKSARALLAAADVTR